MSTKVKQGFTLIEVALFLAVTGLLFIGIVSGVQGSMFQQRYNDSVQNFAEFLRSMYSQVMNVENNNKTNGRSDKAIYGKLIVFGEKNKIDGGSNVNDKNVYAYTVIGDVESDGRELNTDNVLESLASLNINVYSWNGEKRKWELAGISQQYITRWGAEIQTTRGLESGKYQPYTGSILIVRHPRSGTVFTYYYDKVIEVNEYLKKGESNSNLASPLIKDDVIKKFKMGDVDLCLNPNGSGQSNMRRDIRIIEGARNASGVEVIGQDDKDGKVGNKCK